MVLVLRPAQPEPHFRPGADGGPGYGYASVMQPSEADDTVFMYL